jgi:hypothetical protein
MITLLATLLPAAADPGAVVQYECRQTNPMEYAWFGLRFRVDSSTSPDAPISATLLDMESGEVRIRSTNPVRFPQYDLPGRDAWGLGQDENGTGYLLSLPADDLDAEVRVSVTQVFGGGIAQWVNEFRCVEF